MSGYVMGMYNVAAWLIRREAHLTVNAVVYSVLTAWEQRHVAHHLAEMKRPSAADPVLTLVPHPSTELAA